jgi:hypothetical protein
LRLLFCGWLSCVGVASGEGREYMVFYSGLHLITLYSKVVEFFGRLSTLKFRERSSRSLALALCSGIFNALAMVLRVRHFFGGFRQNALTLES